MISTEYFFNATIENARLHADACGSLTALFRRNGAICCVWHAAPAVTVKPGQYRNGVTILGGGVTELSEEQAGEWLATLRGMTQAAKHD